jgi:IS605 OrfB family transposase
MQAITSYKIKIIGHNHILDDTLDIYRSALAYLIDVVDAEWENIKEIKNADFRQRYVETLVHRTKNNEPKYGFDERFYKYPSYYRRSTIAAAIGKVGSFKANYANWEAKGKQGKPPRLQANHNDFPALFRDNTFIRVDTYTAKIKIYHKNDWVWLEVKLRKSDVDYILRHKAGSKETVPTLMRKGKNRYLRFAFEDKVELTEKVEVITAVDLGINNAATCSVMLPDGTVIGRKIFNFPVEQDQMGHKLNKIKKAQQHGAKSTPRLWGYADNYNRALSERTANAIVEYASLYCSDVIVLEHLDTQGKKRGSKKQKLHLWRKKAVLAMVTSKAHLKGMRISTVCAWGTSKLAFDGSGTVERGKYIKNGKEVNNYSMCVFQNGKEYHCDLNASYNIGARYYIREILKSLPETVRLEVGAKAPRLTRRTTCVLSDLINLNAVLAASAGEGQNVTLSLDRIAERLLVS